MSATGTDPVNHIEIVGAGGIGCAVGYALCTAGLPVTFIDADENKVRWGNRNGVRVDRRPARRARFVRFADWSPDAKAVILLCTKCYDNLPILARLPDDSKLVPIQNGFDPDLDARGHAWEGIASFVSECFPGRTHTRITRAGRLHFGHRHAGAGAPPPELSHALRKTPLFVFTPVQDILPFKHTKLMYNAAISPVAAAAGLDNGQLLGVGAARRLFFALLRENYDILTGADLPLARIGPFHPRTVRRLLDRKPLAAALACAFYPSLRGTYCSMSGDLPRGRTEIDYYNLHLIRLAGTRPCPLNRRLYDLVKAMERERRAPGRYVFDELSESRFARSA